MHQSGAHLKLLVVAALFFTFPVLAKDDVKFEGRVHAGAELKKFKNGEPVYDAKIKLLTKRKKGFEGRLALRADSDQEIFLQDAWIDKKFDDSNWQLEFGKHKKRMGLEWQYRERYRMTINRSFIYQQFEIFGYAGRETMVKASYDPDDETDAAEASVTLAYNDSTDSSIVFHGQTSLFGESFNIGGWQLLQWDKIDERRQLVWANTISLWSYSRTSHHFEFELFSGVDPFESEFERAFGDGENVYFYAGKMQYGHGFAMDESGKSAMLPFLHLAYYVYDADSPDFNTIEGIVGMNYYFGHMQLATEIAIVGTNSRLEPSERTYDDSEARVEATVYF